MVLTNSLRDIRMKQNINQNELAAAIGSCGRTIGRIERGEHNASLELALRISKYFEMPVEKIFSLKND